MNNTDLLSIAERFGSPVYVYDAEKIASQYARLTSAFAAVPHLRINYAMKALSNLSVLRLMHKLGSGLDTVSIQEVQLGLRAGFDGRDRTGSGSGRATQHRQPLVLGTVWQQTP